MTAPKAETAHVVTTQWAHVLDEAGSADLYDDEAEARQMIELCGGGGLARIETTVVIPFRPGLSTPEEGSHG